MAPPTASAQAAPDKPLLRGVSHQVAAVFALGGGISLGYAAPPGLASLGAAVYGAALTALFTISALYHRPRWSVSWRMVMRRLDHAARAPDGLAQVQAVPADVGADVEHHPRASA